MSNKYVIFDRDGTLIRHVHHLHKLDQVEIFDEVSQVLEVLTRNGFRFGMVTNQSVIGRNIATQKQVENINNHIIEKITSKADRFDFVYMCPHLPETNCNCRKPSVELGKIAINQFNIDINASYYIGDQSSDFEFGRNLGLNVILIRNREIPQTLNCLWFEDLRTAVNWILGDLI